MLTTEALAASAEAALHPLGPLDPSLGDGAVRALRAAVSAAELAAAPLASRPPGPRARRMIAGHAGQQAPDRPPAPARRMIPRGKTTTGCNAS